MSQHLISTEVFYAPSEAFIPALLIGVGCSKEMVRLERYGRLRTVRIDFRGVLLLHECDFRSKRAIKINNLNKSGDSILIKILFVIRLGVIYN